MVYHNHSNCILKGLPNFGYNCYINASFQLLFSARSFIKALEKKYLSWNQVPITIQCLGFTLVTPAFLECARHQIILSEQATTPTIEEALSNFMSTMGQKNSRFSPFSGQQSSAEFLIYLLDILRNETVFLLSLRNLQIDIRFLTLSNVKKTWELVLRKMSSCNTLQDTPVDDYFLSQIQISKECKSCCHVQYQKEIQSCLALECYQRFFKQKHTRTQVSTEQLLNLFFRGEESNEDTQSSFLCSDCRGSHCIEHWKMVHVAKELIVIYDRIDSNVNYTIPLTSYSITSFGKKSLAHWYINKRLELGNYTTSNNGTNNSRSFNSAIFHNGSDYNAGHYVTFASRHCNESIPQLILFNDREIKTESDSFLYDKFCHLNYKYGTATVALYSLLMATSFILPSTLQTTRLPLKSKSIIIPKKEHLDKLNKTSCNSTGERENQAKLPIETKSTRILLNKKHANKSTSPIRRSKRKRPNEQKPRTQQKRKKFEDMRFTFDVTHDDYENQTEEKIFHCNNFQHFPETAVMLFYLNAGLYAFHNLKDDLSKKEVRRKLCEEIKEQFVSQKSKEDILSNFDLQLYGGVNCVPDLTTCACCGIREFSRGSEKEYSRERGGVRYKETTIDRLTFLQYSEEQSRLLIEKLTKGSIAIPIDEYFGTKEIVPEEAISYYYDEKTRLYYHLHREFVEENRDKSSQSSVQLCHDCYFSMFPEETAQTSKNDPKVPLLSIAAGFDFGDFNRLGLTEPNRFEICALSRVRSFITVLKIVDNTGERRDYTQQTLKGHAVTFDHDAPVVTCNILENIKSMENSFRIHLICEDGKKDFLVEKIMGSPIILGRPYVILQWLMVLKRINILYQYDDIPDLSIVTNETKAANVRIIKNMEVTHTKSQLSNELRESDDIAEIRTTRKKEQEISKLNYCIAELSCIGSSYITDRHKRDSDDDSDLQHNRKRTKSILDTFDANSNDLGSDSASSTESNDESIQSENTSIESDDVATGANDNIIAVAQSDDANIESENSSIESDDGGTNAIQVSVRREDCLNEFTSNEKIIASSFFPIFLLGKAYSTTGGLNRQHKRHMMLQYTGHAGRNHNFIFFLFDQSQRHGNVGGINAVVRSHEASFNKFAELVTNKEFKKKLKKAKHNPDGEDAKEILKTVAPVLAVGGNKECGSLIQRNEAISKIHSLCFRYGMPTLFLTIAIDDVNNFNS